MKFILVILFAMSLNASVAQSNADLVGTWEVDLSRTIDNMKASEKARYDSLPDRVRSNFMQAFGARTYQFNADATIMITMPTSGQPKQIDGSWHYNPGAMILSIQAGGIQRDFIVQRLGSNTILLKYQNIESAALLQTLCLSRQ